MTDRKTAEVKVADVSNSTLEAIAHNLCSLHGFDVDFVIGQERFAKAVITEYSRAAPSPIGEAAGMVAPAQSGWRGMQSAPRDGTKFDVWGRDGRTADVYWSDVQDAFCTDGPYGPEEPSPLAIYPAPTHWMRVTAPGSPAETGVGWRTRLFSLASVLRAEAAEKDGQARQDDLDDAAAIEAALSATALTNDEQKAQGRRCSCRGSDDYCPCQNTPDRQTTKERGNA